MYISIHRKEGRFLHKHESVRTVCDLDFIAARTQHVDVTHLGASDFLRDLTETELQRLYRNTTNDLDSAHHGDALRGVLATLAERFPVTDCNTYEADRQAAWVESNPNGPPAFQYRRGATRPAEASNEPVWPTVAPLTVEEAAVAARKRAAPAPLHATLSPAVTGAMLAPQPVRAVVYAPRQAGKTSAVIFEAADRLWEEAGKPTDMPSVLAVRKKVMDQLEQVGIKRTTCSSTLGAWQKARI